MVTVVIPTYKSENFIALLVKEIDIFFTKNHMDYEIIIVNDCSPDNTKEVLKNIREKYEKVKSINLLRNYGQHNAILCGFKYAKGEIIITMDDDFQNPPEEIGKLIEGINMGFDLVIGAYQTKQHGKFRNFGGYIIDSIQRKIFNIPKDFQLTSFRAIRKHIVEAVNEMSVPYPYVTSMLLSHTTNYLNVWVRHDKRIYGKSNYKLSNTLKLALNLVINYSSIPIYMIIILLLFSFILSFCFAIYVFIGAMFLNYFKTGWASVMFMMSFFSTINLLTLLIFGLYIARIYQATIRVKNSYVISDIYE